MAQRGGGLVNFFKQYERYPGVGINWFSFDGAGREKMPESGYVIENYTRTYKNHEIPRDRGIKSVVQPLRVKYISTPHSCIYRGLRRAVNENFKRIEGSGTKAHSTRLIRLNHYYTKSKEEYLAKVNVRKYNWKTESQQPTFNEMNWAFPEWQADCTMKEAAAALRAKGVPETYSPQAR